MTTDQAIKILEGAIKKPNTKDGLVRHESFFCANGELRGDSE